MDVLLSFLPLLGCAAMMALCMGLVGGARRAKGATAHDQALPTAAEVAALREEVARLRAENAPQPRSVDG